ncbi:MAG: DUF2948 family protein [Rhodobacteraceae bacterium]|jgi:hypothetical protein|nr:DUF2948 family protein [Paracoccaceae bacterium]
MSADARFEDGAEGPLRLRAEAADDLPVISALVQDAVFTAADLRWERKRRRFAVLLNRFRWEDGTQRRRAPERVRSLLVVQDVAKVGSQGFDCGDKELVLSLLALRWEAGEDGTGRLILTLAGDGAVAVEAECLDLTLTDVTRPYAAPSGKVPVHPE